MVSALRALSSVGENADLITINLSTKPVRRNAYRATQSAGNARPGISPVETSAGKSRVASGSGSVMDLV